jgi:hypothetical protein
MTVGEHIGYGEFIKPRNFGGLDYIDKGDVMGSKHIEIEPEFFPA